MVLSCAASRCAALPPRRPACPGLPTPQLQFAVTGLVNAAIALEGEPGGRQALLDRLAVPALLCLLLTRCLDCRHPPHAHRLLPFRPIPEQTPLTIKAWMASSLMRRCSMWSSWWVRPWRQRMESCCRQQRRQTRQQRRRQMRRPARPTRAPACRRRRCLHSLALALRRRAPRLRPARQQRYRQAWWWRLTLCDPCMHLLAVLTCLACRQSAAVYIASRVCAIVRA